MIFNNKSGDTRIKSYTKVKRQNTLSAAIEKNPYDHYIKCNDIMIVDAVTKKKIKECNIQEALLQVESESLNLIQISQIQQKAICIIDNYSKFVYRLNKQEHLKRKSQSKAQNKEIVITNIIDLTDLLRKLKTAIDYINQNFSVTLAIKQKYEKNKSVCFSTDFVEKYLQGYTFLQYKITKKSERQTHIYISKKKQ